MYYFTIMSYYVKNGANCAGVFVAVLPVFRLSTVFICYEGALRLCENYLPPIGVS